MPALPTKSFEILFQQIERKIQLLKYSSIVIYVGLLINFIFSISYVFNASQINSSFINGYFVMLIAVCLIYIYLINNAFNFVSRWDSLYKNINFIYCGDFNNVDTYNLIKSLNANMEFKTSDSLRIVSTLFFIFLLINRDLPLEFSLLKLLKVIHIEPTLIFWGAISFIFLNVAIEFPFIFLLVRVAPKIKSLLDVELEEPLNLS